MTLWHGLRILLNSLIQSNFIWSAIEGTLVELETTQIWCRIPNPRWQPKIKRNSKWRPIFMRYSIKTYSYPPMCLEMWKSFRKYTLSINWHDDLIQDKHQIFWWIQTFLITSVVVSIKSKWLLKFPKFQKKNLISWLEHDFHPQ